MSKIIFPDSARPVSENIHRKRAWGGRMTVDEAWADGLPPDAKCEGCAAPRKMVRLWIRSYMPLPDFHRVFDPISKMLLMQKHGGNLPILETISGPMVLVSRDIFSCETCSTSAERAAAQHPSWMLVEVRRPPKAPVVVQVPLGHRDH